MFLTWGPLMIGGTYLVATGTVPVWVLVFSIPYSLLVTSVLFGKHIDKIVPDTALGIRTVPVILGEYRARRVGQMLMIAFYPLMLLTVLVGWVGPWVLLAVLAIPTLWSVLKVYNSPSRQRSRRGTRPVAGRCGSWPSPSATFALLAACSRWACS